MVFTGRRLEKTRLHAAYSSVRTTGRSHVVVVEAAAGCGKSELLEEFAHRVEPLGPSLLQATAIAEERGTPLSVLRNLVNGAPFPDDVVRRFQTTSDATIRKISAEGRERARHDAAWYDLTRTFCGEVRALAQRTPVVVAVDDLHHADPDSVRQLVHLARHCRNVPLLLVLTRSPVGGPADRTVGDELFRQPNVERIQLPRLRLEDVVDILGHQSRPDTAVAERYLAVSGGNPLLLGALLEDTRAEPGSVGGAPDTGPRPGQAYGKAVLACLDRGGERTREVATGMAVLGEACTDELLSRLLDVSLVELAENLGALRGSGIVTGDAFQHPAVEAAVLESLEPSFRLDLHWRSARLLHASGAAAALAAEHLREAGRAEGAWAVGVLMEAADDALSADEVRRAVSYLELAHGAAADPLVRTDIKIKMGAATRRISAGEAELHVDDALRNLRADRLDPADARGLGAALLAHGRLEQAQALLGPGLLPAEGEAVLAVAGRRIAEPQEGAPGGGPYPAAALRARTGEVTTDGPQLRRTGIPVLTRRAAPRPDRLTQRVADADGLLEANRLTDATFDLVLDALWTLLSLGALQRVRRWCDHFIHESATRGAPGWEAAFTAVRAEGALHGGNLAEVDRDARRCLTLLSGRHPAPLEASAVSHLVTVLVVRGKCKEAARQLSRPMADSLSGTIHWLDYLRARGLYYLATQQHHAALRDFHEVGRIAERWGADRPALLPWRTDIAQALLFLGEREQGLRLATEQLAMTEGDTPRIRGISLRMQGLASEGAARLDLLDRAVVELDRADDRLELARALFDLADAHRQARQSRQAAMTLRKARQVAKGCGMRPAPNRIGSSGGAPRGERIFAATPEQRDDWGHLSESERKVASLAAGGYTNREISVRLYITMSTVEQHLTRVYRKLKIRGREELLAAPRAYDFENSA
ncbi:helix-turn-helix transcriptional regulator [Streptomyces luteogriseus]|uniref:helix-turn-helix transcriptional regulator n=1 Tax=Streptomyces luteogriseus TaxID=68233 RepID=UPI00368EA806